jgi:hypothetical protein
VVSGIRHDHAQDAVSGVQVALVRPAAIDGPSFDALTRPDDVE